MKKSKWLNGRVIVRACIFVLLGAIITVAVAWGCVCWSPVQQAAEPVVGNWLAPAPWAGEVLSVRYSGFGLTTANGNIPGGTQKYQWAIVAGWPFRCLFYAQHQTATNTSMAMGAPFAPPASWKEGLPIPKWIPWCRRERANLFDANEPAEACYLPVRPLWKGLAGNVLLYSAALGAIAMGAASLFRLCRRLRGLCEFCGYPTGTSPVCTECGVPLPSRAGR